MKYIDFKELTPEQQKIAKVVFVKRDLVGTTISRGPFIKDGERIAEPDDFGYGVRKDGTVSDKARPRMASWRAKQQLASFDDARTQDMSGDSNPKKGTIYHHKTAKFHL